MHYISFVLDLGPLGEAVRTRRLDQDMTLKALAEGSGLSLRFLSDLEHGKGNISIARLWAVAQALQLPISALVAPLDRAATPTIALVGLRGAGKTTVGKRLADRLKLRFVELDEEIEATAGLPLGQIFEMHGESYYRRLEREVLQRVLDAPGSKVIATGGGIVTDPESWRRLRSRTQTVWLKARPEAHYQRVMDQGDLRPMKNRPSAMTELRGLLAARSPLYAESEITLDTGAGSIEAAVETLVTRITSDR